MSGEIIPKLPTTRRLVISNAFSVNMVYTSDIYAIIKTDIGTARTVVEDAVKSNIEIVSIVGHESTAKLLSKLLGIDIPVNRANYRISENDMLLVFTISERLPEGKVLTDEEIIQYINKINVYAVIPFRPWIRYFIEIAFSGLNKLLSVFGG